MTATAELHAIEAVRQRLHARYPNTEAGVVDRAVTIAHASLRDARIRDFIPVLVEREARDKIEHLV